MEFVQIRGWHSLGADCVLPRRVLRCPPEMSKTQEEGMLGEAHFTQIFVKKMGKI